MTKIILGTNKRKFFLADFSPMQPIEAIIKLCYRQFHITIPKDFQLRFRLYQNLSDTSIEIEKGNSNLRWKDYGFFEGVELIFEP